MIKRTLSQVAMMANGSLVDAQFKEVVIHGVTKDTREDLTNSLYIPIVGENFNGHKFVEQAIKEKGAAASLWQKSEPNPPANLPLIYVEDTVKALQQMARVYRDELQLTVIGITGSNGKTTTKDIVTSLLKTTFRVHKTAGNYNNHIGLPLTLLSMQEDTEVAVLEMGMSDFGEIELLSEIAKPDAAIITNIGESHLQELGSREGIAKAKLEIAVGLKEKGILVINGDEPLLTENVSSMPFEIITFGMKEENDYKTAIEEISKDYTKFSVNGLTYTIPVLGQHNVMNAVASIAVAHHLNVSQQSIMEGLENVSITGMRNEVVHGKNKVTLINDAYNASPTSMKAAIDLLASLKGFNRKIAVLADMLELGEEEKQFHYDTGAHVSGKDIDYVFTFGTLGSSIAAGAKSVMKESNVTAFQSKDELISYLKDFVQPEDIVLVKGSRGMKLEEVVQSLS